MATRGEKRHLVTLENPGAPAPDGDGGFTQTWTVLSPSQMYAEITPATVRDLERVFAGTVQGSASHVLTMDFHAGVTLKTRVLFGTRVFSVSGLTNPEELSIDLVLACQEVVA